MDFGIRSLSVWFWASWRSWRSSEHDEHSSHSRYLKPPCNIKINILGPNPIHIKRLIEYIEMRKTFWLLHSHGYPLSTLMRGVFLQPHTEHSLHLLPPPPTKHHPPATTITRTHSTAQNIQKQWQQKQKQFPISNLRLNAGSICPRFPNPRHHLIKPLAFFSLNFYTKIIHVLMRIWDSKNWNRRKRELRNWIPIFWCRVP